MRFPLALTSKVAKYIVGNKIRGHQKFATVLQLEPLHTCNLTCTGCGRIREYSTSLKDLMSLEDCCLAASTECGAPMVSVCGGEPLIYPHIEALSETLLKVQEKIVYLCTNAMFMRRKMRALHGQGNWPSIRTAGCRRQVSTGSRADGPDHRERTWPRSARAPRMHQRSGGWLPTSLLFLERASRRLGIHPRPDRGARRACSRKPCWACAWLKSSAIRSARIPPSTKRTDMQEVEDLLGLPRRVRGWTAIPSAPATSTTPPRSDMVKRLNLQPEDFFLTREGTREKFKDMPEWSKRYSPARYADLPRVPGRSARAARMLRVGHPDAQHRRVAGAVLLHGRGGSRSRPIRTC